jgi:hypothetical protein
MKTALFKSLFYLKKTVILSLLKSIRFLLKCLLKILLKIKEIGFLKSIF